MKTIGRTNEGNVLVEMSREEHGEFIGLCQVVAGNKYFWLHDGDMDGTVDLSNVFKALSNLYQAKLHVESLKSAINFIDSAFGGVMKKEEDKDA